ncbi:MAG TPA: hypothetical protein VI461_16700, partial [Chitinophagaceae bacterium]|nr:hypothetical protein [Chitinophagaceae bacterium]
MKQLYKINSKYFFIAISAIAIFCFLTCSASGQRIRNQNLTRALTTTDTVPRAKNDSTGRLTITSSDTSRLPHDSLKFQKTDTFSLKLSKDTLDAPVMYEAEDSAVVLIQEKKIILYGKTKTDYKDISLTAPKVEMDQETQVLIAFNAKDSLGNVLEDAHFKKGDDSFISDTIRYNFKTQKGLSKNTISQPGEMFVHAGIAKKVNDNVTYIKGGLFTTCNLDDPHFAFRADKIKVINQKIAVSGPARPEFEGVPVPVWLPFGIY